MPPENQPLNAAAAQVRKLADDFHANREHFLSKNYQESEVRKDFIDKLLIALGWDVNHDRQKNPFQQEVKIERSVNDAGSQRRADYAFYLAPNFRKEDVRFFIEAKKPFGDIATADNCFQIVRYGWNAQTPLAILTDFEQLLILDCRYKPNIDTATNQIVRKYHYRDYTDPEKFAEIYYLFSHEAVSGGALEQFAQTLPKRRGKAVQRGLIKGRYQSIDESFLLELDDFRAALARAFKNRNPAFDGELLTEITQRVIDRLVFIRFLEDKLIQPEYLIADFGNGGSVWRDFITASRQLDRVYNGAVFSRHAVLDDPDLQLDDSVFAEICEKLAHINSPYDFNSIPIHILGSIYERFLGKVIVATDKRARVEDKPEARKAGGVYYTPEYIVRYIVENTVGKLIAGKSPTEIAELRFADIACGSGSFLLGIYDLLLRRHRDWYNAHPAQAKKDGCAPRDDGAWHLSLHQRREILLNNIYGVDIDRQAVEVAQFSLYLKLLEEETTASAREYQLEFHDQLLPPLDANIVCGNSLIGTDILEGQLFEPVEERKLNPMNFKDRFPKIMKRGGFDAIVGNPPYGMIQNVTQKNYFSKAYKTVEGRFDSFEIFIERATKLIKKHGLVGYIVPSPVLTNVYSRKLRRFLLDSCSLLEITNFSMPVFADPTVHTCILIIAFPKRDNTNIDIRNHILSVSELNHSFNYSIAQNCVGTNINSTIDLFIDPVVRILINKLINNNPTLGEMCHIRQCIKTGDDNLYVKSSDKPLGKLWKPSLRGRSIERYIVLEKNLYVKYGNWLARNWKNTTFYECEKIAIRETGKRIIAALDLENRYFLSSLYAIYPKSEIEPHSLLYYLALINSKLINSILRIIAFALTEGAFTKARTNQIARLPTRTINFNDPNDKKNHDKIVNLVGQMFTAKQKLSTSRSDADRDYYTNRCAGLDRQIDELVYELYGLTPEEIRLVEGNGE